ncbi:hypothetical protein AB9P05_22315 [Roseivirga sp. BDSF3-8]|uniref:hypothetical protein n=1 Tax=Roseivirga sp. BDSF3-8 TaxID=3241598 RepID=UPI0035320E48
MKSTWKLIAGIMMVLAIAGCSEDDDVSNPPAQITASTVQFGPDESETENAQLHTIELIFDKAAPLSGEIELEIISAFLEDIQTTPAHTNGVVLIPVSKGDENASFTLTWTDDDVINDIDRVFFLEITHLSNGFTYGENKSAIFSISDNEAQVMVSFPRNNMEISENESGGVDIVMPLSGPARGNGTATIQLEGFDESKFTTVPAYDGNGQIELEASHGFSALGFKIIPIADNIGSDMDIRFDIIGTSGSLTIGHKPSFQVKILATNNNSGLSGKAKSYETSAGGWKSSKTYEYAEDGRLFKVHWKTETPALKQGTNTYYYAANGLIERINYSLEQEDEYFYQENGRIVKSEIKANSIVKSYAEYDYDEAGNVGAKALYHRQSNGSFKLNFVFINLYFTDGNLFNQMVFVPIDAQDDYALIETRTYNSYLTTDNPFSEIEIIPGIVTQHKLPASYRLEKEGVDLIYNFSYTYNSAGKPVQRSTTGETTTYTYY